MCDDIENNMAYPFNGDEKTISLSDDGWKFISNIKLKYDEKYGDMFVTHKKRTKPDGSVILDPYSTLLFENLPYEGGLFLITIDDMIMYVGRTHNLNSLFENVFKKVPLYYGSAMESNAVTKFTRVLCEACGSQNVIKLYFDSSRKLNCFDDDSLLEKQLYFYDKYNGPSWNSEITLGFNLID